MRIPRKYFAAPAIAALLLAGGAVSASDVVTCDGGCGEPFGYTFEAGGLFLPTAPWGVAVDVLADGTVVFSDGSILYPDGTVVTGTFLPDGSILLPDGTIIPNPYVPGG